MLAFREVYYSVLFILATVSFILVFELTQPDPADIIKPTHVEWSQWEKASEYSGIEYASKSKDPRGLGCLIIGKDPQTNEPRIDVIRYTEGRLIYITCYVWQSCVDHAKKLD